MGFDQGLRPEQDAVRSNLLKRRFVNVPQQEFASIGVLHSESNSFGAELRDPFNQVQQPPKRRLSRIDQEFKLASKQACSDAGCGGVRRQLSQDRRLLETGDELIRPLGEDEAWIGPHAQSGHLRRKFACGLAEQCQGVRGMIGIPGNTGSALWSELDVGEVLIIFLHRIHVLKRVLDTDAIDGMAQFLDQSAQQHRFEETLRRGK
jgi:hypothetical protein